MQSRIFFFLIQYIKLLCEFNKYDEVLAALKREDVIYPFKETLDLCKENKVYDSIIDLYESNGEPAHGIDQCMGYLV